MRARPTVQPAKTAGYPCAYLSPHSSIPLVTGLKNACSPRQDPAARFDRACPDVGRACPDAAGKSAALRISRESAFEPSFMAFLPPFLAEFTVQSVFSRTSAPAPLRLPPTFAAVSHQNATASPPLANTRLPRAQSKGRSAESLSPQRSRRASELGFASHPSLVTSHFCSLIYGTGIKKLRKPTPINEYKLLIYGKPRLSHSGLGRSSKSLRPVISCTKEHPVAVLSHFGIDNIGPRQSSGDRSHRPGNSVLQGLNRPSGR